MSYPIAFLMVTGGFLLIMLGQRHKGLQMIKWAAVGYIGLQFVPAIMQILVEVGRQLNKQGAARTALRIATGTVLETISIVTELITGEEPEKVRLDDAERAVILRDGWLRTETLAKTRGDAFDVSGRVGVVCDSPARARALLRSATMAFRELDGDNHLIPAEMSSEKMWRKMQQRSMGIRLQKDYLSIPEVSRLFLLPTGPLQEKYHLQNIRSLETDIPESILQGDILLGAHE